MRKLVMQQNNKNIVRKLGQLAISEAKLANPPLFTLEARRSGGQMALGGSWILGGGL